MSNIKPESFKNIKLDKLVEDVNLFIQKNAINEIVKFQFDFLKDTKEYSVFLVQNTESKLKEKSNLFFDVFSSDSLEKSNGKLNRFIKDNTVTSHYVHEIGIQQINETEYVAFLFYKKRSTK